MATELLKAGENNVLAFGGLELNSQLLAQTSGAGPVAAGSATAGRHVNVSGVGTDTPITINTTAVKTSSLIFLGIDSVDSVGSYVTNIVDGVSFDIVVTNGAGPAFNAGRTSWWIVNQA